jgi:hypothetical protein
VCSVDAVRSMVKRGDRKPSSLLRRALVKRSFEVLYEWGEGNFQEHKKPLVHAAISFLKKEGKIVESENGTLEVVSSENVSSTTSSASSSSQTPPPASAPNTVVKP